MKKYLLAILGAIAWLVVSAPMALGMADTLKENVYQPGALKPTDSELKVAVGQAAPDFRLPSVEGETVSLSQFKGRKNVVLSFVPAAWTPVCSDQWPGYNITRDLFEQHDAVLLGITVDNIPTLYAWTRQMGELWFPVLSDFWPHGAVADAYGVLRSDGTSERALFFIDKTGTITHIHVEDINVRPKLEVIAAALEAMAG
jgi:peroxiredoxin (alkyl hydroperoxide reductase subunit C)